MANKTVKMLAPALIGQSNLQMRLHRRGRGATVNGAGTAATIDAAGEVTAVVTEVFGFPEEVLAVSLWNTSTGNPAWYPDADSYVYIPADVLGTYYVSALAIDELQRAMREFPPQVRSISDTEPLFFFWPWGSGKSLTVQRSINGGALTACVGTITDVGVAQPATGKYRYRLNFDANDRAVGTVAYRIVDAADNSKVGVLSATFLFSAAPATGNGTNPLTVTVTSGTSLVSGLVVTIKQGTNMIAWGYTNVQGQVQFQLADGTYDVTLQSNPAYVTAAPQAVTVPANATLSFDLVAQSVSQTVDRLAEIDAILASGASSVTVDGTTTAYDLRALERERLELLKRQQQGTNTGTRRRAYSIRPKLG